MISNFVKTVMVCTVVILCASVVNAHFPYRIVVYPQYVWVPMEPCCCPEYVVPAKSSTPLAPRTFERRERTIIRERETGPKAIPFPPVPEANPQKIPQQTPQQTPQQAPEPKQDKEMHSILVMAGDLPVVK